jgi:hypothetical protein
MSLPYLQPYLGVSNGLNTLHAAGGPGGAVGGWVELGRTTLGSTSDSITVSSLADKRYLMVLYHILDAGQANNKIRLGYSSVDTGSNYSFRGSTNGASDATAINSNDINITQDQADDDKFGCYYIANYSSKEKLLQGWASERGDNSGSANPPARKEWVGKWTNSTNPIDTINQYNSATGDYTSGSEVVVLGWDPADTHTNNFWEELASVSGTGSSTSLDTSTFTAKKYLWIQAFIDAPTSVDAEISVGNGTIDSGSNYSYRSSSNGGADSTGTSTPYIALDSGSPTVPSFMNIFVVNNASNEKFFIAHQVDGNTAGASTAPDRRETVGKWANTSNQINRIQIYNNTATNFTTSSIMKVWGAD